MNPHRIAKAFKAAEEIFQRQGALPVMVIGLRADGAIIISPSPSLPIGEEMKFLREVIQLVERKNAREN